MTSLLNTAMCINKKPHPNLHMRQVGLAYNTVFVHWLDQLTTLSLYAGWISLQHCLCTLVGSAYNTVFVHWLDQLTILSLYAGWISLQHCLCTLVGLAYNTVFVCWLA